MRFNKKEKKENNYNQPGTTKGELKRETPKEKENKTTNLKSK